MSGISELQLQLAAGCPLQLATGRELVQLAGLRRLGVRGGALGQAVARKLLAGLAGCRQLESLAVLPEALSGLGDAEMGQLAALTSLQVGAAGRRLRAAGGGLQGGGGGAAGSLQASCRSRARHPGPGPLTPRQPLMPTRGRPTPHAARRPADPPPLPPQELEFRARGLTAAGLAALAPLSRLRRLSVCGLDLPGPALAPLLALGSLQDLELALDYAPPGAEGLPLDAPAQKLTLRFRWAGGCGGGGRGRRALGLALRRGPGWLRGQRTAWAPGPLPGQARAARCAKQPPSRPCPCPCAGGPTAWRACWPAAAAWRWSSWWRWTWVPRA
jgi:hypothetical protein